MQLVLADPFSAAKMVSELGIPMSKYETLAKAPQVLDEKSLQFKPATVDGVPIPPLFAPVSAFKHTWKALKEFFKLKRTSKNSFGWSLLDALHFFLQSPPHTAHLSDPNELEIIIRGDGFPVGGKHAIFLIVTLGNFGILGKTLGFNLPINLAEVDESNREEVYEALKRNLEEAESISASKVFEVAPGVRASARVHYGGDEAWLRMLLGLLSSKEGFACFKCWWLRGTEYDPQARLERTTQSLHTMAELGELKLRGIPFIFFADIEDVHHCAMHAIIPFGKDLLQYCYLHLQKLDDPAITAKAQLWLQSHRISHVDITYQTELIFIKQKNI